MTDDAPAAAGEDQPGARDPLIIRELRFLGGMASADGWRPELTLPEIAFVGRSNVGKSSLLNRLVRRRAFARVSRTPGRTREINFFAVNEQFVLVDLPGYGYARVSKTRRQEWRPMLNRYLTRTNQLRGVVMLLDVRREPTDDDRAMLDFLGEHEVPVLIAVTKIDKLAPSRVLAELERISERGGVLGAMETGYQRGRIQDESMLYEQRKHDGSLPIVGVNTFLAPDAVASSDPGSDATSTPASAAGVADGTMSSADALGHGRPKVELARSTEEEKQRCLTGRRGFQARHAAERPAVLDRLRQAALSDENLFAVLVDAVRVCTLGEITDALFEVGGRYRRNV